MGKLEGTIAIVTGAGQGIGRGIALAFAKEGAKVVVAEFNPKTCDEVTKEIQQLGKESLGLVCDVGDRGQVNKMVQEVVAKFGTVDILVNNAVAHTPAKPFLELEDHDWDVMFQTGVKGTWYCCTAAFPYMKDRGGKIINFTSAMGTLGLPGSAHGAAAKDGIRALSRVAAREWGQYKININCIMPSAVTPAFQEFLEAHPELVEAARKESPLQRFGDPESDIGRVAVFLAGADSDYMTGQTLAVDGGHVLL